MQTSASYSIEKSTTFTIYFTIKFKPRIDISDESLKSMFCNESLSLAGQTKMNNHVGMSIHLVSILVMKMGGKFTQVEKQQNGEILIMFTIPFESVDNSDNRSVNRADIRLNSSRTDVDNGRVLLQSPEVDSKIMVLKFNQESGDEVGDGALNKYISKPSKLFP